MLDQESIKIWHITNTSNFVSKLPNDLSNKHYLLDRNNNTNTFINKLLDNLQFNKQIETFIELWKPTTYNTFRISYIKKENITYEHPSVTYVLFLSDDAPSIISLDLDFEQYKYKRFVPENKCLIIPPKQGKIVSINPKKFYGFHTSNTNLTLDSNILMINLWQTKPSHLEYYSPNQNVLNLSNLPLDIKEELRTPQNIYIKNSIFNEQFYEQLLYKKNYQILCDLYDDINENYPQINLYTTNLIIHSQKKPLQNIKYFEEKREKYGNIINDIYELEVNNIIPKNLLQKINNPFFFSPPIIDWYNIELNKNDNQWQSIENNTSKFSLNTLPYLSTFIFTHTDQILERIKDIYRLGSLNIHINSYFIEKIKLDKESKIEKINNYFLSFFIVLRGSMNICFEKDQNHIYIINKGDLIVFGGENYTIKSTGIEDIIVLGSNIEYTI